MQVGKFTMSHSGDSKLRLMHLVASPSDLTTTTASAEAQRAAEPLPESAVEQRLDANVDLRFLQDPNIYHPLPTDDVAPAFSNSKQQPQPGTPLTTLLQHGHFRRAAEDAANELLRCASNGADRILQLLYTRLACLVLVSRTDLAAQEAIPLIDLLSRNPPGAEDVVPRIPWELRLLLVRLQSIGAADGGRRGVMAMYALAAEVRAHLNNVDVDEAEHSRWAGRLRDLGLRVADALVEMGELETANRHLDTLTNANADEIAYRKALLRARVGDVAGAQNCVKKLQDEHRRASLKALLKVADGELSNASDTFQALVEQQTERSLLANNLAVSMLYTGHIIDSRRVLKDLSTQQPGFSALLFNLSTVYELCTERAVDRKTALAQAMAAKAPGPDSGGWEKATFEFKL